MSDLSISRQMAGGEIHGRRFESLCKSMAALRGEEQPRVGPMDVKDGHLTNSQLSSFGQRVMEEASNRGLQLHKAINSELSMPIQETRVL